MKRNVFIILLLGSFFMVSYDVDAQSLEDLIGGDPQTRIQQNAYEEVHDTPKKNGKNKKNYNRKAKFVLRADTTTAEGMYVVGVDMCDKGSGENTSLYDWTFEEKKALRVQGSNLIYKSAAKGYSPAQKLVCEDIIYTFTYHPNPDMDKIAISYLEKAAEGNDAYAVDAMLYLMWNYYVGQETNVFGDKTYDLHTFRVTSTHSGRFVGPVDLKKSRYYLEKILANKVAADEFIDDHFYIIRSGGNCMGREAAEWCLNELNKKIGDRATIDLTNGLAKKVVGRWKMNIYDGITSVYTINSNGTFSAHHTYKAPATKQGWSFQFDTNGEWHIGGTNTLSLTTKKRYLNHKITYNGSSQYDKRTYLKLQSDKNFAGLVLDEAVRSCEGGVHYHGWMETNYLKISEIDNKKMNADFSFYTYKKKNIQLIKLQ